MTLSFSFFLSFFFPVSLDQGLVAVKFQGCLKLDCEERRLSVEKVQRK